MVLEPLNNWIIGRIAITKASETIVLANVSAAVTKFALVEWVSKEAEAAGYKRGDLLMAKTMHNIFLKGGTYHRVTFPVDEVVCRIQDVDLSEFVGSDGKPLLLMGSDGKSLAAAVA